MTPLQKVYDAFLSKILEDEWAGWTQSDVNADLLTLLEGAIDHFKFPRHSMEISGANFTDDLTNEEIQILACYMKCEWLNRTILTWENVKPLYEERDFSQANLLAKFNETLAAERKNAERRESKYYRSIDNKPFDYTKLATQLN